MVGVMLLLELCGCCRWFCHIFACLAVGGDDDFSTTDAVKNKECAFKLTKYYIL